MGRKIEETHARNEVPIVVGGTSYWIQHLIFPERMASLDKSSEEAPSTPVSPPSQAYADAFASLPPELLALFNNLPESAPNADADPHLTLNLHRLLTMFDPLVAQRWHWRDSRKVLTNLRIIHENRRLASEIIRDQSQTTSNPRSGRIICKCEPTLIEFVRDRYRTLCFWLYAKPDVLKPRLDERVDQMIAVGKPLCS